jgi:hypothetical protein
MAQAWAATLQLAAEAAMLWFLVLVTLLVFTPGIILIAALGALVLAIPFIIFFVVWIVAATIFFLLWPGGPLFDVAIAFLLGMLVARYLMTRTPRGPPYEPRRYADGRRW